MKNFKSLYINLILLFASIFLINCAYSQSNTAGIFFQAVARDNYANPAKDRKIYVQSTILQKTIDGNQVLIEIHETNTDATGVFGITVGLGRRVGGSSSDLSSIPWSKGPFFLNLKIAISPTAPIANWDYTKDWVDLGTTPFGTVPYAIFAESVAGFDTKLNNTDTAKMLQPYARTSNVNALLNTKLNISDSTNLFVTPAQLAAKTFDSSAIYRNISTKINIADSITKYVTPAQLAAKTFDSTTIYNQLALKANITDVNTSLALKANTVDVNSGLNQKENVNNKSIDVSADGTSDAKYPSAKAVKTYVDSQVSGASIADANATTKGKIQLAGDLSGTASSPTIANNAIVTSKILDGSVTDAKILNVSGSKVVGNIAGNAATATRIATPVTINGVSFDGSSNITIASTATNALTFNNNGSGDASGTNFDGSSAKTISYNTIGASPLTGSSSINTVGTITSGVWSGTAVAIANGGTGATNASDARANLGLTIGTDVLAYRTFGSASNNNSSDFESAITTGTNNQYWRGDKTWQTLNTTNVAEGTNLYFNNERARSSLSLTSTGNSGAATYSSTTGILNIPEYTLNGLGYSLNGLSIGTQTFSTGTNGSDFGISSSNGVHTFNIPSASGSNRGLLTSTDWTTFNNKANNTAFTSNTTGLVPNPTSSTGRFLKDDGSWSTIPSQVNVDWNAASGVERILNKPDLSLKENISNKSTAVDLGDASPSDILYPSQKAVKSYIDVSVSNAVSSGAPDATTSAPGKVKLAGDLTGTANLPIVASVGGSLASNINTATIAANAATNLNTTGAIVKRDGSGNFSAGTITANLNGNVTGNLTGNVTGNVTGNATNVTGIVAASNGGTGVDNSGKAITLGGNLTTSGAFNTTFTLSGNTNISLPTSGTLVTLTGSEALTNKTINGLTPTALSSGFTIAGGTSTSSTLTVNNNASVSGTNTGDQTITLTGDITGSGSGTFTTTLANSGVVANTYGTNNSIPTITVDSKGRITNVTNTTINAVGSTLSNGTILIGNSSNQADAITMSGDVTIDNTGVTSIGANKVTNTMLAGNIDLTTKVNGTLPVANGGTGANSFSAGFLKADGTNAFTTVSNIPVANITGAVSKVNGVSPNTNGEVSLTFGRTFTGLYASYNASSGQISTMTSPANSDIYIVAGDPNTADNGRTFVYDGSRWQEISNNQSATDARYVQLNGSTVTGNLVFTGANNKVTVEATPSGSYDLTNKTYVDTKVAAATISDADATTKGKLKLAGDLGGTAASPSVVTVGGSTASAINTATLAANAATNANTVSTIVKRDPSGNFSAGTITANLTGNVTGNVNGNATNVTGTVAVANGGTGATSLSGYLKGNGTSAFTASAAIPVADITGAEAVANKATATDLGSSSANDTKYPTQLAVKTYVDTKVAAATIADADATTKGKLQLAGDLGGTATSPTVVTVGGSTASNINAATLLANAATNLNTASAIVKRDASGNFSAGTITASLSGNATNVTGIVLGANGGTGVANSGKTITLGGNLTTSGAYNTTLTTTANTNITLPASGTIATLTGSEALTNKTINGLTPTALSSGFTIAGGTSTSTTLTVGNNASVSGTNTGDQTITLTGDITGTGTGTFTSTLANSGVTAGSYGSATSIPAFSVDAKGRITSVTNTTVSGVSPIGSALTSANIIVGNSTNLAAAVAVTGDVTISNTGVTAIGASKVTNTMLAGSIDLTNKVTNVLPIANGGTGLSSVGTNGQVLSSNGTGIVWSNPTATVTASTLSGTTLASNVVASSLTSVGTITAGVWSGTAIASNNIVSALTGKTYNGITPTAQTTGFTLAGGTTSKTLTVSNDATVSGINTGDQTITLTGDVTGSGSGTFTTTLSSSGVAAATYGSSTAIPVLTVDAKGRVTSASTVGIIAGVNTLTYTTGTTFANGGTVSGTTLTLAAADGTNPGLVSTGAQTIAGAKTFTGATTTVNGNLTGGNVATSTLAGFAANINPQTGTTYTLLASDNGKIITLNNASAITLTVPSGLIVGFNCMIVQLGAGQVTIAGSGATVINRSGFTKTGGQNAITTLISVATNSFISSGDMSN